MAIRSFQGDYRFLSNFYGVAPGEHPVRIVFEGAIYRAVEYAYVAAKLLDPNLREEVRLLPTPGQAKRFLKERGLARRADWHEVNLGLMEDFVRQKFSEQPLKAMLLDTGDEELIEGNTWHDVFWGVDAATGEGRNHLGRILMKARAELRQT